LGDADKPAPRNQDARSRSESPQPQLIASTKLVPRRCVTQRPVFCPSLTPLSDVPTKKGHLMILVDATQNFWERRWFVLRR